MIEMRMADQDVIGSIYISGRDSYRRRASNPVDVSVEKDHQIVDRQPKSGNA
jgi:hypothetical protein